MNRTLGVYAFAVIFDPESRCAEIISCSFLVCKDKCWNSNLKRLQLFRDTLIVINSGFNAGK
jgi:hypothetical protein